ncbi:MAG: site-specific integrase [Lentisphaerae bacterium]|nr:site-specific integrase [Lentisphaerota bacterium]
MAPLLGAGDDKKIDSIASTIKRSLADDRNNAGATGLLLTDCWDLHPHVNKSGRKLKQSSIDRAAQSWRVFVRFCANRGVTTVAEVTERVAADFLDTQTPRMRVLGYQYCRAMFERIGSQQPFTRKPPAPTPTHREPLTHEQISALLARADSLAAGKGACASAGEFATFTRFLLYTGLRMGDAATIRVAQVDYQAETIERTMAKTSRPVRFPLHPDIISRLPREGEYLFPAMAAQYLRDGHAITRRFARLFKSAGIVGEAHQYCAHALRTTFASICAEHDVPLAVIQSWLGHNCPSITRIYARIEDMRAKRAALAKFPTLG